MKKIPFIKFSGAGNDFLVIDNRDHVVAPKKMSTFVAQVCKRHLSVGGDGLIFIEKSRTADFRWRFFNNDGGEAEFCGNGARCAARFAYLKRIAPKVMRFEGAAGMVEAKVSGELVTVRVPEPTGVRLNIRVPFSIRMRRKADFLTPSSHDAGRVRLEGHAITVGVPHFVYFVRDTGLAVDVLGIGRLTRYHDLFKPAGTNVNFVHVADPHTIYIRTYERGVEDETLACGSGSVASALIASLVHKVESPVTVVPLSRMPLRVTFQADGERFSDLTLTGDARAVYEGLMHPVAWEYELR